MAIPAIIAALPREVAILVEGVRADPALTRMGIFLYRLEKAVVVCAGMGSERVTLAVRAALEAEKLTMLVSCGLAGACDPALMVSSVVSPGMIVDAQTGARFTSAGDGPVMVTTHSIASVSEKRRLFASYGASLVDMEAATVARLAELQELPFRAIKAVSDAHDFELSSLSKFSTPHGHFRTPAFALHTALRPHRWRKTLQLGAGSQRALRGLNAALKEMLV